MVKQVVINKSQIIFFFTIAISFWYFLEYLYVTWLDIEVLKNSFIYYNLLNQFPVFLLGIMTYFINKNIQTTKFTVAISIFLSGLFGYITIVLWRYRSPPFDPFMFIPFTVGVAFVFLYFVFAGIRALNFKFLQRIGQVSYSMYIWHFMFAWYVTGYLNRWFQASEKPNMVLIGYYMFSVLLSFLVGFFSERIIEKPGINLGKSLISKIDVN